MKTANAIDNLRAALLDAITEGVTPREIGEIVRPFGPPVPMVITLSEEQREQFLVEVERYKAAGAFQHTPELMVLENDPSYDELARLFVFLIENYDGYLHMGEPTHKAVDDVYRKLKGQGYE